MDDMRALLSLPGPAGTHGVAIAHEAAVTSSKALTMGMPTRSVTGSFSSPSWRAILRDDEGSGTIYGLGIIGAVLALFVLVTALIQAQTAGGQARLAADLAALGGATVSNSIYAQMDACAVASQVAAANAAVLISCELIGEDVLVSTAVDSTILGIPRQATARARAGPVADERAGVSTDKRPDALVELPRSALAIAPTASLRGAAAGG